MRAAWPLLPEDHRRTATNLANIRFGAGCLLFLILAALGNAMATRTPGAFVAWLLSFDTLLAPVALVAVLAILIWRAMATAPVFLAAYREILPGDADAIDEVYSERGLGDVIAPWVRGPQGRWGRLAQRIGRQFRIVP